MIIHIPKKLKNNLEYTELYYDLEKIRLKIEVFGMVFEEETSSSQIDFLFFLKRFLSLAKTMGFNLTKNKFRLKNFNKKWWGGEICHTAQLTLWKHPSTIKLEHFNFLAADFRRYHYHELDEALEDFLWSKYLIDIKFGCPDESIYHFYSMEDNEYNV